jgi:hypothetical protein
LDGVSLETRSRSGVACFRSSVAIPRHLPRRPQVLVGMLRDRRPQGHSKKRPHRNGWSGSQPIENARDGVRPLGTTAHNATGARLRFGHIASRTRSAPPRDRETSTEGLTRDFLDTRGRSLGIGHQRARDYPQRVPWPNEPNIADEIRERRAGTDIVGVIALNTGTAGAAFSHA